MRELKFKAVLAVLLGILLGPIYSKAQQLELYKSVDSTTIQAGNQLVYVIQYSCVSTTAHCDNVEIRDTLPSDLTFVSFLNNPIHSSNTSFNAADNEVIFELNKENGGMGMKAGSTGEVRIVAQFPNGATPNNTLINNTAFITSSTATDTFSNATPSTSLATSPWELTKTGNGTAYLGLPFIYTLQVVDPTNGAVGGLNINNVTVIDTLPLGAMFNNANNGGIYDATHRTVTWNVGSLTLDNNSNNLQVTVTYEDADFDAGDMVTNNAVFLGQPVGEPTISPQGTAEVTKTLAAPAPGAGVTKSIVGNSAPIIGDTLQYDIEVTNSGTTPLDTFYMVDTLPAALNLTKIETGTFSGANMTIRYKTNLVSTFQTWTGSPFDGSTNTTLQVSALGLAANEYITILEYDFENVPLGFENTGIQLFAAVINPDHNGMTVEDGTIITNCGDLHYQLAAANYQTEDCTTVTVRDIVQPSVDFEKEGSSDSPIPIGSNFSYVMILNMEGDFAMDSIVMIDTVPENMAFYQTESGGWNELDEDVEVYYQTNLNSTFQTWAGSPFAPTSDTQLPTSALGLAANEMVTIVKWVFRNPQRGFAHNGSRPRVYGTIKEAYPDGSPSMKEDIITNCTYVTAYLNGVSYSANSCDFIILDDPKVEGDPDKSFIVNGSEVNTAGPYAPKDTITYLIQAQNNSSSTDTLINPILMDLLPTQVTYLENSWVTADNPDGQPSPTFENIQNYNNTGRTLLRWSWKDGTAANFTPGEEYTIHFKVVVNPNVFQEEIVYNYGYQTTNDSPNYSCDENSTTDTNDLDGDGLTTDLLCYDDIDVTFNVFTLPSLESEKLVKGQLDTAYTKFPEFGETVPGGDANYQLFVRNNGTVPMTNVMVIDILPFVGDMGVIDLSMRETRWRPFLIGPLNVPTGVTVYYSTEQNPCRSAEGIVPSGPAGCTAPNWSTIPPADITTVQSFKLDFGSVVINPGDELMIDWDMKAPVNVLETIGSPADSIAWNSFGYIADRVNVDGSIGLPLLPSEPIKVGIRVQDPKDSALGNYVWLDDNKDGIQDMAETGVNGVPVHLYVDNGDGIADPSTDSLIATTLTATGGLYLFPELPADDYFVAFYPPPTYTVTTDNTPTNDSLDSDGIDTLINGIPVAFSQVVTLGFSEINPTLDLGLSQTDIASVGNYVWFDENEDGLQNEPTSNGVNGIPVYLYDDAGVLQDSTITQNDLNGHAGYYLFDSIPPADYYIEFEIPTTFSYSLVQQGAGGSDVNDSDATPLVDTLRARTETFTLVANQHDPTWDAGIILPTGNVSLGNFVWIDSNNDGIFNNAESGLNGVTVNLYQDTDNNGVFTPMTDAFFATTTTITSGGNPGYYLFDNLPEGNYIVQITESNFSSGQSLGNYNSSNGNGIASDPDDNINFDDNGEPLTGYGVVSQAITLSIGDEPTNDEDTDSTSNLTVDFGFFTGDACLISVENFNFGNCSESTGSPIIEMNFDITWLAAPDPAESIQVTANGVAQTAIITTAESNGTQSFAIHIPADGTASDIKAWFTTSTACGDTLAYTAPTGCPLTMIKTANTSNATIGDIVNYNYTVYNNSTDTVTLSDITDDKIGTISTIQTGAARTTDSLIALYLFDSGSGAIISDVSGFGSPLDLTIEGTNYSWGMDSLNFIPANRASNDTDLSKIHSELSASNAITVEAWVMPAASSQAGPARMVTLSGDSGNRNFSLMQDGTSYQVRLRTSTSNANGSSVTLNGGATSTSAPQHLVFTRDASGTGVLYQNGVAEDTETFTGDFSSWDDAYDFGIGNEFGTNPDNTSRDFQGTFYIVAVYSKALSAAEVVTNYTAGRGPFSAPTVLLPGENAVFTAPYEITMADLPSPVINTAEVTGTFKNGGDITVSDTAGVNILCTDISATFTFAKCHNNGTAGITTDDYQIYQVTATHSGSGTQYQVVLDLGLASEQILATANYGATVLVGNVGQMQADNSSTYTLTVRDVTDMDCQESIVVPAVAPCSVCPPEVCLPIKATVIRGSKG